MRPRIYQVFRRWPENIEPVTAALALLKRPEAPLDGQYADRDHGGIDDEKDEKDPHPADLSGLAVCVKEGRDVDRGEPSCLADHEGTENRHECAG